MTNVMEVQQELISRLAAACRREQRVPDRTWLADTLAADAAGDLVELLRTVYPYAHHFEDLPAVQRELLLERVRAKLGRAPRASRAARPAAERGRRAKAL